MYEGIVEKEQEKVALKAAEAERADNPKVQRAIDHAKTIIERNKFDGAVPQAEVEAAQRRLAMAEAGDYARYWQEYLPVMREARRRRYLRRSKWSKPKRMQWKRVPKKSS